MSSRKCSVVCSCKSSSRWFKVSEELHEDVCACFNVEETVVLGDGSLCSSCRRNLSRWREKRPTNGKYFNTPNSRGKPGLNKAPAGFNLIERPKTETLVRGSLRVPAPQEGTRDESINKSGYTTYLHFITGASRRRAPVLKCRRFLSFFQRYIVRDTSLTEIYRWLVTLARSLKSYRPFSKALEGRPGGHSRERL